MRRRKVRVAEDGEVETDDDVFVVVEEGEGLEGEEEIA